MTIAEVVSKLKENERYTQKGVWAHLYREHVSFLLTVIQITPLTNFSIEELLREQLRRIEEASVFNDKLNSDNKEQS